MRRGALVLAGLASLILVVGSLPAAAYVSTGYDPRGDSVDPDGRYDIRSTVRAVERGAHGRRLRVTVRIYGEDFVPGAWVYVDAKLDARGGRATDAVLHMWILDMSGSGCQLQTRSGKLLKRGRYTGRSDAAMTCRVPVHPLHPTKAIRWKIATIYGNGEPVFDVAPDHGMYV